VGIVWEPDRLPGDEVPEAKLRPILEVLPVPPLSAPLRRLIEWTADYYVRVAKSAVARMALASYARRCAAAARSPNIACPAWNPSA
jgi:primosomal protein N' (replication factor Y)